MEEWMLVEQGWLAVEDELAGLTVEQVVDVEGLR